MMKQTLLETTAISPQIKSTKQKQIVVSPKRDGLTEIAKTATSLVIWERHLPSSIIDWLSHQAHENLPHGRILTKHEHMEFAVASLFKSELKIDRDVQNMLQQDIIQLANCFASITMCDRVDIRLEVIQHDACQKFHLDNVAFRLVTTYIGENTQYVLPEFSEQAMREQQAYAGPFETVPDQSVAIFKGARATSGDGIVHRSPPIEGTGQTRLFLCINMPSNVSPTLWQPGQ